MKQLFVSLFMSHFLVVPFAQVLDQKQKAMDVQLNAIRTAVPFLGITPDSRSGAMGDVGVALSPDANSLYWNTSKLVFTKSKAQFDISYSPWLRQLADDMHLSYVSGYYKVAKNQVVGGSLRYFSLGDITFTNGVGDVVRNFNPNEFEVLGGYAFRLSDRSSVGLNAKFVYSNLTGGINVGNIGSKPAVAGAVDLSYSWFSDVVRLMGYKATWSLASTVSNIGNKVSYALDDKRDFLPTSLKMGTALKLELDDYNALTGSFDINKFLVPTDPITNGNGEIISGKSTDVGVIAGMLQSFYDAPGNVITDEEGNFVTDENGTARVEKGSRFKEEMREINFGIGVEYLYSDVLAVRTGFFHEPASKGNRKHLTFGAGIYFDVFGLDISYLASVTQNNPLANTVRFSLKFKFNDKP